MTVIASETQKSYADAKNRRDESIYSAFAALVIATVVAAAVLGVFGGFAANDPEGGHSDHAGPVPSDVRLLADDEYFLSEGAQTTPQAICLGTGVNGTAVEQVSTVPGHGTFLECGAAQRWNVKPRNNDTSWWEGIAQVRKDPIYLVFLAACCLIVLGFWLSTIPAVRNCRRWRRAARADTEQMRRELGRQLAEDPNFTAGMYDEGIRKLYGIGLKPAKD